MKYKCCIPCNNPSYFRIKEKLKNHIIEEGIEFDDEMYFITDRYPLEFMEEISKNTTYDIGLMIAHEGTIDKEYQNFLDNQTFISIHNYNLNFPWFRDIWMEWAILTEGKINIPYSNFEVVNPLFYFYGYN